MKKDEIIAMKNRLEYLKDKADRQDKEIAQYRKGMDELQKAAEIVLKQVLMKYGGKEKEIVLERYPDLDQKKVIVSREKDGRMIVRLTE